MNPVFKIKYDTKVLFMKIYICFYYPKYVLVFSDWRILDNFLIYSHI